MGAESFFYEAVTDKSGSSFFKDNPACEGYEVKFYFEANKNDPTHLDQRKPVHEGYDLKFTMTLIKVLTILNKSFPMAKTWGMDDYIYRGSRCLYLIFLPR